MGFHTGYSMMFGMLFGWMVLAPLAVNLGWTTPESVKSLLLFVLFCLDLFKIF
jgi:uncharacterized oligopeptide transporter (OPT) family protein